jgi:hypothetical protein
LRDPAELAAKRAPKEKLQKTSTSIISQFAFSPGCFFDGGGRSGEEEHKREIRKKRKEKAKMEEGWSD